MSAPEQLLYPGRAVDAESFLAQQEGLFLPVSQTSEVRSKWEHGDLVRYLLGNTSVTSVFAEKVGEAHDVSSFTNTLEFAKRDATIHLPGRAYAFPDWAAQFAPVARQIIEYEHATNPRADNQIAQLRSRQYKGQPRNTDPHIDMIGSNVRNFHFYLLADQLPAVSFKGRFDYEPHPDENTLEDPLAFFQDLDVQFAGQTGHPTIARQGSEPFDIMAFSAMTVHEPPAEMPLGRTLFAIQFYELAEGSSRPQGL